MRLFPYIYVYGCLAVLLITSSCSKSSVEGGLQGKWKLVSYSGGPTYPSSAVGDILTLHIEHSYEIRYNDSLVSSGIYHVGHPSGFPRPVLYFGSKDYYGSMVRLNKDSLELSYAGGILAMYLPPVCRYVKVP